jgi:hypothetical protein
MSYRLWSRGRVGEVVGLSAVLFLIAGCTKVQPVGTVEGKVTLNGQPFSNARLNFLSQGTGSAGAAEIGGDGSFKVATPLKVGTYTVFLAPRTTADPDHPSTSPEIDPKVPAKCWNESTSTIRVEVKTGKNEIPIELAQ